MATVLKQFQFNQKPRARLKAKMESMGETLTDEFLETVRKELNEIIKESESKTAASVTTTENSDEEAASLSKSKAKNFTAPVEATAAIEKVNSNDFLNAQTSKTIDQDLQKMQLHLQQSYELFQTIGDRFDTIQFGGLKGRIKSLHSSLSAAGHEIGTDVAAELKELFQQSYLDNRLDKLTAEASGKLSHHPGEFGDIPEVSAFFKACSQLQHGLDQLRRHRDEVNDLGKRMNRAAELSYNRIDEIQKQMHSHDHPGDGSTEKQ